MRRWFFLVTLIPSFFVNGAGRVGIGIIEAKLALERLKKFEITQVR